MRFITEFELDKPNGPEERADNDRFVKHYKGNSHLELGSMIGKSFGWQNPVNNNNLHYRLEIEAFPMDKWIEFKSKLFSKFIDDDYEGAEEVIKFVQDIESFGKPAGEGV